MLTHSYEDGEETRGNDHEHRPYVHSTHHGYSVQSSVLSTSGAPEEIPGAGTYRKDMTRFDSEQDAGDFNIVRGPVDASYDTDPPAQATRQPAGYDLSGMGGDKIASPPNMQARGFRQETILLSHEGYDQRGSDYSQKNVGGFRFRQQYDRV